MNTNDGERKDARELIEELGWPSDIPVERLVASVYDKAMESGMIESAMILGFTFDRAELPRRVTREDRLVIALNALAHFASDRGLLEMLRYDGALVPDEVLESGEWNAPSPMLPSMHGLYEAARQEWDKGKAEPTAG
jgi:hypothetical protein